MPVWKVLLVLLFALTCLGLATATVIVPLNYQGGERWLWTGGLVVATAAAGVLFTLFLRHASAGIDGVRR